MKASLNPQPAKLDLLDSPPPSKILCIKRRWHTYIQTLAQLPQPAKLDLLDSPSTTKILCTKRRGGMHISGATTQHALQHCCHVIVITTTTLDHTPTFTFLCACSAGDREQQKTIGDRRQGCQSAFLHQPAATRPFFRSFFFRNSPDGVFYSLLFLDFFMI